MAHHGTHGRRSDRPARHRRSCTSLAARARAYCLAQASPLKNIQLRGRTAGTSLHAAALSMARGTSGVWLRVVCRLGLLCRGTVYLLVGYLALRLALAAHGRAGPPAGSAGAGAPAG